MLGFLVVLQIFVYFSKTRIKILFKDMFLARLSSKYSYGSPQNLYLLSRTHCLSVCMSNHSSLIESSIFLKGIELIESVTNSNFLI